MECQAGRLAMGLEAQETRLEKMGHGAEEDDGGAWSQSWGRNSEVRCPLKISKVLEPRKIMA